VGCSLKALIGAFCAVQADAWHATVSAMAPISIAGELAAELAQARGQGVGTIASLLLDTLQPLDEAEFSQRVRLKLG
jgi:hydroxyethylthiazole kinase